MNLDTVETLRSIGEINQELKKYDDNFIKWVMSIGEARNILNNAIREFQITNDILDELEHNIPQFHKQPGLFVKIKERINSLMGTIKTVNHRLSYVKEEEEIIKFPINDNDDDFMFEDYD